MQLAITFNEVLEAAAQLTLAEQESLIDILRRRLATQRRAELFRDVAEARIEFQLGRSDPRHLGSTLGGCISSNT